MSYFLMRNKKEVFLSERFQRVVSLHVLKNLLKNTDVQVPLLLGVHGPSGEGKTFQVENILKKMGVKRFLLSGGQIDSPTSGEPSKMIREMYLRASEAMRSGEASAAVVLINDVETGLGGWGSDSGFTHTQTAVFGELMHLVDYPSAVEGKETTRVPVIITGNDFTKLYEPLVRAGRMTSFEWIPTPEERAEILAAIFPELAPQECLRLVYELSDALKGEIDNPSKVLTIAFFAHLRSTLMDEDLWQVVRERGMAKTMDIIITGEEPDLTQNVVYGRVYAKGLELARSGELINHLK